MLNRVWGRSEVSLRTMFGVQLKCSYTKFEECCWAGIWKQTWAIFKDWFEEHNIVVFPGQPQSMTMEIKSYKQQLEVCWDSDNLESQYFNIWTSIETHILEEFMEHP